MSGALSCPTEPSLTGAYRLSWKGAAANGATFQLLEDGALLYEGPDVATTVTGRPEGRYTYALVPGDAKEDAKEPLATCVVEVKPPPMAQAVALLGLGGLVFLATLVLVVLGHRAHRREARPEVSA